MNGWGLVTLGMKLHFVVCVDVLPPALCVQDENEEENTVRLMPGPNPSWFSCVPLVSYVQCDMYMCKYIQMSWLCGLVGRATAM